MRLESVFVGAVRWKAEKIVYHGESRGAATEPRTQFQG
jgi:hypothetical protein